MTVLYNEIEPYAADWLVNLVNAGHIANGNVERRSIVELKPEDVRDAIQFHAFAGIGGWSYALRLAGWPDTAPVWTGSCPCQPFSQAGRRKGTADERHLWPEWFRLIRECLPPVVLGEQVASKDGLAWWDQVATDLESVGYGAFTFDVPACAVGAPHIRQRLYFAAVRLGGTQDVHELPDRAAAIGVRVGYDLLRRLQEAFEVQALRQQGKGRRSSREEAHAVTEGSRLGSGIRASLSGGTTGSRATESREGSGSQEEPDVHIDTRMAQGSTGTEPVSGDGDRVRARSGSESSVTFARSNQSEERLHAGQLPRGAVRHQLRDGRLGLGRIRTNHLGEEQLDALDPIQVHVEGAQDSGWSDGLRATRDFPTHYEGTANGATSVMGDASILVEQGAAGCRGMARTETAIEAGLDGDHRVEYAGADGVGGMGDAGSDGDLEHVGELPSDESEHALGAEDSDHASITAGATRGFWSPCDWIPCADGVARPVEPGTFPLAHGATARVGRLRAYGNAIVAPLAAEFIGALMDVLMQASTQNEQQEAA